MFQHLYGKKSVHVFVNKCAWFWKKNKFMKSWINSWIRETSSRYRGKKFMFSWTCFMISWIKFKLNLNSFLCIIPDSISNCHVMIKKEDEEKVSTQKLHHRQHSKKFGIRSSFQYGQPNQNWVLTSNQKNFEFYIHWFLIQYN